MPALPLKNTGRPVSRRLVLLSAAVIVLALSLALPALNPHIAARSVWVVGWLSALPTAHLAWAVRVGAIRRRFVSWGVGGEEIDGAFAIAVINPRVLTVEERATQFWSYVTLEAGFALLAWIIVAGPALLPLLEARP